MKLSLPVRSVIFGQLLEQPGRVDEPAGIERRLDRDDAVDFGHRLEDVVLEVHAGEGGLSWNRISGRPTSAIAVWYATGRRD